MGRCKWYRFYSEYREGRSDYSNDSAEGNESIPGFYFHRRYRGSTIDGILVTTTGAVTRDIYQKIINKNATDEAVMSLSKVVTVIIGIVVICFGVFQPGSIFEINLFAFSGMAIFVVPILFGIYWKKATAKGAVAAVIVGIISLLLFTLNPSVKALAMGFHALFPTTIIASIVMIVVSKFTETPPQETIDRHFTV